MAGDGSGVKVMVIDDSKTIRRTAETLLKKEGFEVVTATDGFDALSKIAEAYYGDTDAACMIFDRNRDVFGTREAPIRRNDPHCILPEDILFLPAIAPDADFGRCVTPPRRANVCEAG